jgi:hypothetical protein
MPCYTAGRLVLPAMYRQLYVVSSNASSPLKASIGDYAPVQLSNPVS